MKLSICSKHELLDSIFEFVYFALDGLVFTLENCTGYDRS